MLPRLLILIALVCIPATAAAQQLVGLDGCSVTQDNEAVATKITDPNREGARHVVLSKNVVLACKEMKVFADEVEGDTDRDLVQLRGNVVIQRPGLTLTAEHAVLDRHSHNGTLFNVYGSSLTSATPKKDQYGQSEPDFAFWAAEVAKTGPETFELKNGSATSCVQATPRWSLSGTSGTLVHNKRVTFVNAVLRVKDVPVFYIPYIYYPINKEDRSTGFLMPSFGSSRIGGFQLSNAFFMALSRSTDATIYHEYMKKAGNGVGGEYRFVSAPGSNGDVRVHFLNQRANAELGTPDEQSYTLTGHLNQGMPHGFRLVSTIDYYSSATAQQLYQQNLFDVSSRTRGIDVTLTGGKGRYRFATNYAQHDVFQGYTTASRLGYAPQVTLTMADAPVGRSRVYFGANTEAAYLLKQEDLNNPITNHNLWRFDARPHVSAPLSKLSFLSVTTSAALQLTEWMESRDPLTGEQIGDPLTRSLFSTDIRMVGPVFARIWQLKDNKVADRVKHVIEPNAGVQWYSPFNELTRVVQIDGTDAIVGGTATYNYGLTNRLLIRKPGTNGTPGPVRELMTVDITQSYYTNTLASTVDPYYAPCATGAFSAVRVSVAAHPTEQMNGTFTTDINPQFHTPCTLGASAGWVRTAAQFSLGWSKRQYIPGLRNFDDPQFADHFLNGAATWRRSNGHLGGTYSFQYDVRRSLLVQQRVGVFYNSQCCGISVDYQAREVPAGLLTSISRNRSFNFAFTLGGLGSFSNPLGSFGR